ncbi:unnamed protein product [Tetraodon nigroviridis]|uniref:(spotted green pufferfish) hypothetical protein n=1 Tax=Tetraodon nigroviridis TaxID=99883 RepID=Q4RUX6_TETNG|nr:unnamed protein product [Tetraodon nigroviridis]
MRTYSIVILLVTLSTACRTEVLQLCR